ncbi:MAG: polysaccharide deacetylase family protein, partial [Bacteroidota bacterium]
MSFDDGPEHDLKLLKRLNKANIVGTFHLNSGRLGEQAEWLSSELEYPVHFVSATDVQTIYQGHEVSAHGVNHAGLDLQNDSIIRAEVGLDLAQLNQLVQNTDHQSVQGLAYPFGAYNDRTLAILKALNVQYARTTASTHLFELPIPNFLTLHPTCHVLEALDFSNYFVYSAPEAMQVLNIWGHSYEFHDNWKYADSLFT